MSFDQQFKVLLLHKKLNIMNCGNPTLPCNSCPSTEVYFLKVSCVPSPFMCNCRLFLKLTWIWSYIPSPGPASNSCPASTFRYTDELWVVGKLTAVWVSQATSSRPPPQSYSCPGHNSRENSFVSRAVHLSLMTMLKFAYLHPFRSSAGKVFSINRIHL